MFQEEQATGLTEFPDIGYAFDDQACHHEFAVIL